MNLKHSAFSKLTDDEKDLLRRRTHKVVTQYLQQILEDRIASVDRLGEETMENPNWPILRAFRDGRVKELQVLRDIITPAN